MKKAPFYMVFLEEQDTPAFKHTELLEAENEARRLAMLYKKKSYVLCSIKSFEFDCFKVEDYLINQELPF